MVALHHKDTIIKGLNRINENLVGEITYHERRFESQVQLTENANDRAKSRFWNGMWKGGLIGVGATLLTIILLP